MILVLNEWVFHDLLGENGEAVQRETAVFLNDFYTSHDKLVLPREPRWSQKAYQLMTLGDARLRNTSKQSPFADSRLESRYRRSDDGASGGA